MKTEFLSLYDNHTVNCIPFFNEPKFLGFTGGANFGDTALFGCQMSSIIRLNNGSFRIYLTKRTWPQKNKTLMDIGYIDTNSFTEWPLISDNYSSLIIENLPDGYSRSQPYVIFHNNCFEMFFWVHGGGMIRYVKCLSQDGINFRIVNLDTPCLYHPADRAVRIDNSADNFLTIKDHLQKTSPEERNKLKRKISNDATSVSFNPVSGFYTLYSVTLLDSCIAPERIVDSDNAPGWLRVIHHRKSRDGIEWSDPEIIMMPEEYDRKDLQFYVLQHLRQEKRVTGIAGYYPAREQTMEFAPAVSYDGLKWIRSKKPWDLREKIKSSGGFVKMLFPGGMFEEKGCLFIAAAAFNFCHNQGGKLDPGAYCIENLVISIESEKFAGLKNNKNQGGIVTPPLLYEPLKILSDEPDKIKISLLSPFNKELLTDGKVDKNGYVRFSGNKDKAFIGKWVKLKLKFNTVVYNLSYRS